MGGSLTGGPLPGVVGGHRSRCFLRPRLSPGSLAGSRLDTLFSVDGARGSAGGRGVSAAPSEVMGERFISRKPPKAPGGSSPRWVGWPAASPTPPRDGIPPWRLWAGVSLACFPSFVLDNVCSYFRSSCPKLLVRYCSPLATAAVLARLTIAMLSLSSFIPQNVHWTLRLPASIIILLHRGQIWLLYWGGIFSIGMFLLTQAAMILLCSFAGIHVEYLADASGSLLFSFLFNASLLRSSITTASTFFPAATTACTVSLTH